MGTDLFCDGCGKRGESRMTRFGLLESRDYCDECVPVIELYMKNRDGLHERVVLAFQEGAQAIRDEVLAKHPNLSLPDDF